MKLQVANIWKRSCWAKRESITFILFPTTCVLSFFFSAENIYFILKGDPNYHCPFKINFYRDDSIKANPSSKEMQ